MPGDDAGDGLDRARADLSVVGRILGFWADGGCQQSGGVHIPECLVPSVRHLLVTGLVTAARRDGGLPRARGLTELLSALGTGSGMLDGQGSHGQYPFHGCWVDDGLPSPAAAVWTVAEAAAAIGISARGVRRLCLTGRLRASRLGHVWMVERQSAEDYRKDRVCRT